MQKLLPLIFLLFFFTPRWMDGWMDGSTGFIIRGHPGAVNSQASGGTHFHDNFRHFFPMHIHTGQPVVVCLLFVSSLSSLQQHKKIFNFSFFFGRVETHTRRTPWRPKKKNKRASGDILFCFVYIFIGMDVVVVRGRRDRWLTLHFWDVLFSLFLYDRPQTQTTKK